MEEQLYTGLDIGGTKLAAGLVNCEGKVLLSLTSPTEASRGGATVLTNSIRLVETLLQRGKGEGLPAPVALGIAAGGRIDTQTGKVLAASEMIPGWAGTALVTAFQERFGLPCRADNDVNAQALAEYRFGAGQGYRNVLYVAAGTGLGGGLVLEGQLYRGTHFSAGEVGHTLFQVGGLECDCGKRGCLEQYTATPAIIRYYQQQSGEKEPTTIRAIAALANENPESPAGKAFSEAGFCLGTGLVSLVSMFDPEIIILGGGLVAASPLYLNAVRQGYKAQTWSELVALPLVPAQLAGRTGIIGAAALVIF